MRAVPLRSCSAARLLARAGTACGSMSTLRLRGRRGRIVEIHRDWAVTELAANGSRRVFSTAKVFKRAKKSLGIRSRRTGFGARSQWLWQLPRQSDPAPIKAEAAQERRGPIPIDWVQGVACLHPDRPPNDLPRHRWRQFRDDCKNFLSSSEHWAGRAAQLGWDAMALFGCAPKRPLDCGSSMRGVWGRWA
jgi:hypothetical protein